LDTGVSERAETYLRLMAETELRRALALPKVRLRRHRRFPSKRVVQFAFRRLGPVRFALHWVGRIVLAGQAGWHVLRRIGPGGGHVHGGAEDGLRRLAVAADALAAVDAIDDDVAKSVIADQAIALEVRQRLFGGRFRHMARPAIGPPTGQFLAVGIAKRARLEVDGDPAEITLLSLVITPDRAVLTIIASRQTHTDDDEGFWFLDKVKAVDNLGSSYSFGFSGGGDDQEWAGELELHPVPRAGVRWLDLTLVPGSASVRIGLDQATAPEPAIDPLPRSELAERYLDKVAEVLLAGRQWQARHLSGGVKALLGTGLITPDNEAIARLATLARRLGVSMPLDLPAGPDTDLPERWLSVLDATSATDGPTGVAAAAAVLPELDGTRWTIAGLRSKTESAELQVLGWGADGEHSRHHYMTPSKFSWWARDNTGRWHIADQAGGSWGGMHTDLTLKLTPALHPAATSIDVVVTGRSGQVTVTLPLDWTPALDWTQP
jgi:hypothetical protein